MVFWWTGRGFLSLLLLIGVFGAFGAVLTLVFGDSLFETYPSLWGVGVILAAVANWIVGSRLNRRPALPKMKDLKRRLTYPPRNRFLSMPMEIWSVPLCGLGVFLLVRPLIGPLA